MSFECTGRQGTVWGFTEFLEYGLGGHTFSPNYGLKQHPWNSIPDTSQGDGGVSPLPEPAHSERPAGGRAHVLGCLLGGAIMAR